MPLLVPSHALPLIAPADNTIPLAQCDAEIESLQKIHCKALTDFWAGLKANRLAPEPGWGQTQHDLHDLLHVQNPHDRPGRMDSPEREHVSGLWSQVIAEFDADVQAQLQMPHFVSTDLVAVITQDQDVTVVHRYQGQDLYNVDEDALSSQEEEGPGWFFRSHLYEPPAGPNGSPYQVPTLYLIGTIDPQTHEWAPKAVGHKELYEIIDAAQAMESLIERNALSAWTKMALPAFASGVQTRLQELSMLRAWLMEKSRPTPGERLAAKAARSAFEAPIAQLRAQIRALEDELRAQVKLQNTAELQAELNWHGFELGQQVTHAASGQSGVLRMSDDHRPRVFVDVPGTVRQRCSGSNQFECEMRLGEWSAALPEHDDDDAVLAFGPRP